MATPLDFPEDSPAFRKRVAQAEENVKSLHGYADRVGHSARRWVHYGQKYADAHVAYGNELLASVLPGGDKAAPLLPQGFGPALSRVSATLKDLHEIHREGCAVTEATVGRLAASNADDLGRVKEAKRRFAETDEMWATAVRRAHSVRKEHSGTEARDADRDFVDAKLAFECARFELVAAVNEVEASKQLELIESMRGSVTALASAYEQSCGRMRELAAHLDSLMPSISEAKEEQSAERARNHATVLHLKKLREEHRRGERRSSGTGKPLSPLEVSRLLTKEGYLYKKSSGIKRDLLRATHKIPTGTSSWKRLWFRLDGGVLYYYKKKGGERGDGVRAINLLICTIRENEKETGKRFCFDLVSPYRSYTLQAESAAAMNAWMEALRASIEHTFYAMGKSQALHGDAGAPYASASDGSDVEQGGGSDAEGGGGGGGGNAASALSALAAATGNDVCADCGAAMCGGGSALPDWVVMPYGVLVCIECSGIHRSLGVHISKVRSITLDTWTNEMATCVSGLGNEAANSVLLASGKATVPISATSSRAEKEVYIREKYQKRTKIVRDVKADKLPSALCAAARVDEEDGTLPLLALILQAESGGLDTLCKDSDDREWREVGDDPHESSTSGEGELDTEMIAPAHAAAAADAPRALELLLLAGATLDLQTSSRQWSPCHTAAANGSERCLTLLVRRSADLSLRDASGRTPIDLARANGHDGCVQLLTSPTPTGHEGQGGGSINRWSTRDRMISTVGDLPTNARMSTTEGINLYASSGAESRESSFPSSRYSRNSSSWAMSASASTAEGGCGSSVGGGSSDLAATWPQPPGGGHQRTGSGGLPGGLSSSEVIASLDAALGTPPSPPVAPSHGFSSVPSQLSASVPEEPSTTTGAGPSSSSSRPPKAPDSGRRNRVPRPSKILLGLVSRGSSRKALSNPVSPKSQESPAQQADKPSPTPMAALPPSTNDGGHRRSHTWDSAASPGGQAQAVSPPPSPASSAAGGDTPSPLNSRRLSGFI